MSFLARTRRVSIATRQFSTEPPKITLARNILRLAQIQKAKDEAELKKIIASPLPTVDVKNLPIELAELESHLAASVTPGQFKPNPDAWQNKDFFTFATIEATRAETWPFVVGFGTVFLLGLAISYSLPEEARKNSKYAQLLDAKDGRKDHHGHDHEEHGHAHH